MKRWGQTNGYRDVLVIGLPLVVSMGTTSLIHFTDRVFLGNYSVNAIAAALPAGVTSFLFLAFFMGVASYVNVFIAQYTGAGAREQVGASLWQGIYFSFLSALVLASLNFIAEPLFTSSGHPPEVQRLEVTYFRILTLGAGSVVMATSLSCFFSGRGLTRPVMMVNLIGAAINIPLDYVLINGVGIFPELGIAGAGIATITAQASTTVMFALLIFSRENNRLFAVWRSWRPDRELFGRLMKFGLPGGVQFFLDMFAVTFFVFMVGKLGKPELAATNIVFAISTLSFLPMVGLSIAVSVMVGQAIGRGRPDDAVEATKSTIHIAFSYMSLVALLFVTGPEPLLDLFRSRHFTPRDYADIMSAGVVLLRFVAVYTLFDALAIIYFGALKGAGDIYFVMWAMAAVALGVMVLPVYFGIEYLHFGLYSTWIFITLYIAMLGLIFRWRYRGGRWKKMRVIEERAAMEDGPRARLEPAVRGNTEL